MGRKKGSIQTEEQKRKVRESLKGRKHTQERIEKVREALRKRSKSRKSWTAREWRRQVLERDGHKCVRCGSLGPKFHVHHIVPWKKSIKLRFEVSNGQTLCASCHAKEGWKNKELSEKGLFKKGQKPSEKALLKLREYLVKPRKPLSEEHKKAISLTRTGKYSAWNKGKAWDEETKRKVSQTKKGSIPWNKGKKGIQVAWNKGIPVNEEKKKKISDSLRKYYASR